jgi:MSHA biogenesis protein MshP
MKGARQAGFTLVSAIFLMVVLVTLGVSIVTLSSVQHATTAQQLQSVRATYAARAGVEWAAVKAAGGGCPAGTLTLTEAALDGFSVTVACSAATHTIGTDDHLYYQFNVTAQSGVYPSPDFVSRQVQAKVLE